MHGLTTGKCPLQKLLLGKEAVIFELLTVSASYMQETRSSPALGCYSSDFCNHTSVNVNI